ncbi:hypothetical protein MRB53_016521 [Persea americana]|uniref:Uncharacterized protein n=1 Tax=Persea americana TaxID=3435 RepID=A0ACC2M3Q4_PERAE|nr:hypothetical protein MRB53_016521 [Persea americana]
MVFCRRTQDPQEIEALTWDNDTPGDADKDVEELYWPCNMVGLDHDNSDEEQNEDEDKAESSSMSEPSNSTSSESSEIATTDSEEIFLCFPEVQEVGKGTRSGLDYHKNCDTNVNQGKATKPTERNVKSGGLPSL